MTNVNRLLRKASVAGLICWSWQAVSGTVWAAGAANASSTSGAYVFPYFVVVVGIGLGLAVACHPSRRREKAKPEAYTERKLV